MWLFQVVIDKAGGMNRFGLSLFMVGSGLMMLPLTSGSVLASPSQAQSSRVTVSAVDYSHHDWQVVCDNTRTCRIAGYSSYGSDMPVSVLLTRPAGATAAITGEVKLGSYDAPAVNIANGLSKLGDRHRLRLLINSIDQGEVGVTDADTNVARLSNSQVQALLTSLATNSRIEFVLRNSRWQLSDKGAAAVLLKADEAQGRINTTSAFIRRGNSKQRPLPAVAMPTITKVIPNQTTARSAIKAGFTADRLSTLLQPTLNDSDDCPLLQAASLDDELDWQVYTLNSKRLLVSHQCWMGAYNIGMGMWLLNAEPPYQPKLITTDASFYDQGEISMAHKGRGLGDCYAVANWVWTGDEFAKSHEGSTGMCRLIEAGGAWQMPTYVTKVIE